MKLTLITAAIAAAAVLTATAVAAPSGDTCTYAAGTTGTYTVTIVTGTGIQQYTLGFTTPGLTVKNIGVSGKNGTFTTQNLPPGTTSGWTSDESLTGTVTASLTATGTLTGKIGIVPSTARATPATTTGTTTTTSTTTSSAPVVYDAVVCAAATGSASGGAIGKQTVAFSVTPRATWSAAKRGWLLAVKVPTGGIVSATPPKPTTLQPAPATSAARPLVQVHRVSTNVGRSVTLTVKPTSQGQKTLASAGVLRVKLLVTFDAKDGREGHKTISLTLRK